MLSFLHLYRSIHALLKYIDFLNSEKNNYFLLSLLFIFNHLYVIVTKFKKMGDRYIRYFQRTRSQSPSSH